MKEKLFSLIELIVVIVVLGILAAIVIPNVSNVKNEAELVAMEVDHKNIQTAVDLFHLEKGFFPTYSNSTEGQPEYIEESKLNPEYLRNYPEGSKFWIDHNGLIWLSTADSPSGLRNENGTLTWNKVEDADGYNIYEVQEEVAAGNVNSNSTNYVFVGYTEDTSVEVNPAKKYVVSSIDKYGLESPPVNGSYYGIPEGNKAMRFHKKSWIRDFSNHIPDSKTQNAILLPDIEGKHEDFSGEAWIYWDGEVNDHASSGIWGFQNTMQETGINHFEVRYRDRNKAAGQEGSLRIRLNDFDMTIDDVVPAKEWVHVAFSYDSQEKVGRLFVNGEEVGAAEGEARATDLSSTRFHSLGDSRFFILDNTYRPFYGEIKEFRLWNKALKEEDVREHMNKTFTGSEDNLLGYWKLNNIKGSSILDSSSNRHHGKINANPVLTD